MKKKLAVIAMVAMMSSNVFAGPPPEPLVIKSNVPGYVQPGYGIREVCEVYKDKVVISRYYGYGEESYPSIAFTQTETRPIRVSPEVANALAAVSSEQMSNIENIVCDGPTTTITAKNPSGGPQLRLFYTGGCSAPREQREGPATYLLSELVKQYCPVTHY